MKAYFERLTDEDLFELLVSENSSVAYERLYLKYYPLLLRFAFNKLGDFSKAEDITQEVLMQLWKRRSNIRLIGKLNNYLIKAIKYKILDDYSKQRYKDLLSLEVEKSIQTYSENTDHLIRESTLKQIITSEISKLPPRMKTTFLLSRNEGLTHEEIAQQLGISVHTVSTNIRNAIKILKNKILTFSVLCLFY